MQNADFSIAQMTKIHSFGIDIAIDDFGTGYSCMAYLKLFPVQTLKLDRSFVRDMDNNESDESICIAIISLAHSLGMKVVAEGVETQNQKEFLISSGCDILQGYYYSRPLPANEFKEYIKQFSFENA